MPFPSRGCRTCKTRRIKCDEMLPACQRCLKSQRLCSWIGVGVVYRPENHYASGHVKRPRGPRANEAYTCTSGAIVQCPSTDLKKVAILHYLKNHIRSPDEAPIVLKGLSDDLFHVWDSVAKRPVMLSLAVSAMALAVYSRTQRYPPAAVEASTKYLQVLRIAQSSILSMDTADIDAYLLAIFFMGRYENVVYHIEDDLHLNLPCASVLRTFSHHDGARAMLKLWKDQRSETQLATDVIKHTRRCMIKSTLLRALAIPDWMIDGALFGECGWELDYDRLVVRIANLRHQFSILLRENPRQVHVASRVIAKARALSEEVETINEALQTWMASSPNAEQSSKHTVDDWQAKGLYSTTAYIYTSAAHAAMCLLYQSTRLLINSTKLKILDFEHLSSDESERLECLSQLKSIANDIASTLPFYLQKSQTANSPDSTCHNATSIIVGNGVKPSLADLAVWPLSIAASIGDLEEKQRSWFRAQLASIGRMIGDRVIEVDAADRWFRL